MIRRRDFLATASKGLLGASVLPFVAPGAAIGSPAATGTGLVYDPRYLDHVLPERRGETHPERPLRLVRMMEVFAERGLDQEVVELALLDDPQSYVGYAHTEAHVESVRQIDVTGRVAELAVAGALGCVEAVATGTVKNAFCASRPPGHHANNTGQEEGFCFYSNAAIAARYAQRVHGFERVLIVDWDYHHGNATQNAFYDDPTVLFFSTHDWQAYPGTGDPALTGEGDGTDDAFRRMTKTALELADEYAGGRLVSLLEGGYNVEGNALVAAAHLETLIEGS